MTRRQIDGRLHRGEWICLFTGVYRPVSAPESWLQKLKAATLWAGEGGVASHHSAALLWELPGVTGEPVEVTTPRSKRAPGVCVHRGHLLRSSERTVRSGIPTTTPLRTILDLAPFTRANALAEMLDDLLRRKLVNAEKLRARATKTPGRRPKGVALVRALLAARGQAEPIPESVLETRLDSLLREHGLPPPTRQLRIREGRAVLARVDFAYPEHLLAIEADGARFHSSLRSQTRDRTRANVLAARGWRVLRFDWDQVTRHPRTVADSVRRALSGASDNYAANELPNR